MSELIKIAIADDHVTMRNGLALLLKTMGYTVLFEGSNGQELIQNLDANNLPNVVLMDINMPQMDGFAATDWLRKHHPSIKVLALSTYDDEGAVIRMLKFGARGYLLKSVEADELRIAINNVHYNGYHYSEMVKGPLFRAAQHDIDDLKDRELHFLKLASTEMTYKEIADEMNVSFRTVDGYRETLFEKLHVKSRIGLVLFAIKNHIVHVE